KEALDQFRGVFDTLRSDQAVTRQERERARPEAGDQARPVSRPLLLDISDLRDRLLAALKSSGTARSGWRERLPWVKASSEEAWREGLRLTLRRLDQVLLDRRVV